MNVQRKIIALLLSITMFIQVICIGNSTVFASDDYSEHWAADTIEKLISESIITGYSDGSIKPDNAISRAEFVTLVNKLFGYTEKATSNFSDVESDAWYADQFSIAKKAGYVSGDNYGYANPTDNITRAEVCSIISRALGLADDSTTAFTDNSNIPNWARSYIGALSKASIISGYPDGSFGAKKNITRAEAFTIINNTLIYSNNAKNNESDDNEIVTEETIETTTMRRSPSGGGSRGGGSGGGSSSSDTNVTSTVLVTFNLNYDIEEQIFKTITIPKSSLVDMPELPKREDYTFVGWYTNKDCTEIFYFDTKIENDTVLYANWIDNSNMNENDLDFAYNALEIDYADGDSASSVINNVGLRTVSENAEVSWSSDDNSIISNTGIVNRPNNTNKTVKLTATLSVGEISKDKVFEVIVIKNNSNDTDNIHDNSYDDIADLNGGELPRIITDDDGNIKSIRGKYSDINIQSSEDAILSLYSVKTLLGISNPETELVCETGNYSNSNQIRSYVLKQYYNGLEVVGRKITIVADADGNAYNLNTGYISNINIDTNPTVSSSTAISKAKEYANTTSEINNYELVVYPNDNNNLVLAYRINIGTTYIYVNANTADVITSSSFMLDFLEDKTVDGKGKSESNVENTFPVRFKGMDFLFFYLQDYGRDIKMYKHTDSSSAGDLNDKLNNAFDENRLNGDIIDRTRIGSETNHWWGDTNKTAISAYTNVIRAYDWYLHQFNHRSVDGNGMEIQVNIHGKWPVENTDNSFSFMRNNACWVGHGFNQIIFFDNTSEYPKLPTYANCLDVIGHEYTHGVFESFVGTGINSDVVGAINEGYADIFGSLIEGKNYWEMGEDRTGSAIRDAEKPTNIVYDRDNPSLTYLERFDKDVFNEEMRNGTMKKYRYCTLISHSAALMRNKGLTDDEVADIWYNSLYFGYDNSSDFYDVADNVISAAKMVGLNQDKIDKVIEAFEETNIYRIVVILDEEQGEIIGKVVDAHDGITPIVGATIKVYHNSDNLVMLNSPVTDENGQYVLNLNKGSYRRIVVSAPGYIPVEYNDIELQDDILYLETILFLDENQNDADCKSNIKVTSATTGNPIQNANVRIRSDWNTRTGEYYNGETYITDSNGNVNCDLPAGYYTAEVSIDGYTTGYCNIISSAYDRTHIVSLSPLMPEGNLRVVLTWDRSVSDLDSHFAGPRTNDSVFHVYYSEKHAYDNSEEVANLDVDDTTYEGPETVTLLKQIDGTYKYSVYNYSGGGDNVLPNSHAKIEVYKGETLWYVFNVPTDQSGRVWNVFELNGNTLTPINVISNDYSSITNINSLSSFSLNSYELMDHITMDEDIVVSGGAVEIIEESNKLPVKSYNDEQKYLIPDAYIDEKSKMLVK